MKGSKVVARQLSDKIEVKRQALRPPGAIEETQFLIECTRCGDCAESCPHDAIHLMDDCSKIFEGTPFIDVYNRACEFCPDFACIKSCKPAVLKAPVSAMGKAKLISEHCLVTQGQHCDYCFNQCPDDLEAISKSKNGIPIIDNSCVGCGKCAFICVSQTGKAIEVIPNP